MITLLGVEGARAGAGVISVHTSLGPRPWRKGAWPLSLLKTGVWFPALRIGSTNNHLFPFMKSDFIEIRATGALLAEGRGPPTACWSLWVCSRGQYSGTFSIPISHPSPSLMLALGFQS